MPQVGQEGPSGVVSQLRVKLGAGRGPTQPGNTTAWNVLEATVNSPRKETPVTSLPSRALDTYWHDIRDCTPISQDEEIALTRRARTGDTDALGRLVSANLRFVVSVAREFQATGQPLQEDGTVRVVQRRSQGCMTQS